MTHFLRSVGSDRRCYSHGSGRELQGTAVQTRRQARAEVTFFARKASRLQCSAWKNTREGGTSQAHPPILKLFLSTCAAACVSFDAGAADAVLDVQSINLLPDTYAETVKKRHNVSSTLTPGADDDSDALEQNQEMFTKDAWLGMKKLVEYGKYVDTLEEIEASEGCEMCRANREVLEHAWQVVANEHFDPRGRFSQLAWAGELQNALKSSGGALRTKSELYTAAKNMIGQLHDQYSEFLDPAAFRAAIKRPTKAELDYMSYQAVGVGMRVGDVADGTGRVVVATLSGSAAEAAGLKIGDVVLSVDGIPASRLGPDALRQYLRGPVGSAVDLVVHHVGNVGIRARESLTLLRQALPQVPAAHKIIQDPNDPSRVAQYIRINYFSSEATNRVMEAIVEAEAFGVDGYILDLRNNPGGVFEEAIAIASYFLDMDGPRSTSIVETVRNTDPVTHRNVIDTVWEVGALPTEAFPRHAWGLTNRPMAVLTNHGSASASEVLTGALQDNQRAAILGQKTFGKGVVQYFFRMEDGSGLKLTVAKYLTPNHRDISLEGGIDPDMVCLDHPRGVLPDNSGVFDSCIRQGLQYVQTHPSIGTPLMRASR